MIHERDERGTDHGTVRIEVGARVWWNSVRLSVLPSPDGSRKCATYTETGTVYRLEVGGKAAVLPDIWAAEGKTSGILMPCADLTLLVDG